MRSIVLVCVVVSAAAAFTGCRDVCEKRNRVIDRECGFEPAQAEDEPECEGEVEALAECVVDHSEDFCEFLEDLQTENSYTACARDAMGG